MSDLQVKRFLSCPGCGALERRFVGRPLMPLHQVVPAGIVSVYGTELGRRKLFQCRLCSLRYYDVAPSLETLITFYNANAGAVGESWSYTDFSRRQHEKLTLAGLFLEEAAILDVGCHTGIYLQSTPSSWRRSGVDMNPSAIELARKALPDADLRAGTFEQTEFPMHSFDIITAWDVMEHVHDVQGFLGKVDQLLKPGGFFVFETGNFSSTFARFAGLSWYYYSPIEHTVFYDPRVIHHVLPRSGFQVLKIVRTAHADPHEKYGALRTRVLSVLVAAYSLRGRLRLMHVLVARLLRKNGTVPQPDFLDHVVVTARKLES